jgi:GT2 family glycosyltransferase
MASGTHQPFFSVIVPTRRRPRQLRACLQALIRLDYPSDRFEVIVVGDGGPVPLEPLVARCRDRCSISLLEHPELSPSSARNMGAAIAKGDFLAFTADDCAPAADWMQNLAARFAMDSHCAVGGSIVNGLPADSFATASHTLIAYLYQHYNADPDAARFFTPNNLAVPTKLYRAVGAFDVSFVTSTGEDREFCDRWLHAGYRMAYAPEVVVTHAHPLTFRAFWLQQFRYGQGTFRHRLIQARRAESWLKFEPPKFYFDLLCYPLAVQQTKKHRVATLLGISQVANAAGFLWEFAFGCR